MALLRALPQRLAVLLVERVEGFAVGGGAFDPLLFGKFLQHFGLADGVALEFGALGSLALNSVRRVFTCRMSLAQILDEARSLTVPDKLHLIRVLATDIDDGEAVEPLEHGRTYRLATPVFEPGAAEALLAELKAGKSN